LAAVVAATVPTISEPTVVELGPGTGVISDAIARRLRPAGGRQLAVELHPDLAAHLRHTRPWLQVLAGDAAQLTHLLSGCGVDQADAVVSALPWTLMSAATQQRILEQIHAVLVPGGGFTTIITLSAWPFPACRRFRHLVEQTFGSCVILGPIWHNLPPALVLTCTKAHHA
jgi:phospholipid N-methyltransferase